MAIPKIAVFGASRSKKPNAFGFVIKAKIIYIVYGFILWL
jgi:hypothetical protein